MTGGGERREGSRTGGVCREELTAFYSIDLLAARLTTPAHPAVAPVGAAGLPVWWALKGGQYG